MNQDRIEVMNIEPVEDTGIKIRNIEKFFSPQGEGFYTGAATVWLRTWGCTNRCRGFGASDPTDPNTYDTFTEEFDPKKAGVESVTELPVFSTGCDSRHTWDKRYRHLAALETPREIADQLTDLMRNEYNPEGHFLNPYMEQENHLAITGGEPMMHQDGIMALVREFIKRDNIPRHVTIETNCTVKMSTDFVDFLDEMEFDYDIEFTFSMSPKLQYVSGDDPKIAHKPDVVAQYASIAERSYLKIVVLDRPEVWNELEERIADYISESPGFMADIDDLWVMPVGSDDAGQAKTAGDVATKASQMGYRICPRAHIYWFGNEHCT